MHYAHTREGDDGKPLNKSEWQLLYAGSGDVASHAHLNSVANLCRTCLGDHPLASLAELAGFWHDLGKFSSDFQKRLERVRDASNDTSVDHMTAGAWLAMRNYLKTNGEPTAFGMPSAELALAFCIRFHHGGLKNCEDLRQVLANDPASKLLQDAVTNGAPRELLERQVPAWPWLAGVVGDTKALRTAARDAHKRRFEFAVRMIFSALLDADFLDTERHMRPEQSFKRLAAPPDALAQIAWALDATLGSFATPSTDVGRVRAEVLAASRDRSAKPPGLFTLTVPTGGGKTLSSLAFAIEHALKNNLGRVIIVIPYTSIIEQTAEVYRELLRKANLPEEWLLEHHSGVSETRDTQESRLASENWEAPLVVTTSVQFFESLHGRKSSVVRKLHNIARSVVILDEVQTLPSKLLQPCLDALGHLVADFDTSVVLCTATQPALFGDIAKAGSGGTQKLEGLESLTGKKPVEIIHPSQQAAHFGVLGQRVAYHWRRGPELWRPTWEELAIDVLDRASACDSQALVVVNTRADAQSLFEALAAKLKENTAHLLHLSALMCPAHRKAVLGQPKDPEPGTVRRALADNQPCIVVSTQVIEAGVDVDFPLLYRALAGLDSIAQAAGRCNREGRRERGDVHLFDPQDGTKIPPTIVSGQGETQKFLTSGDDGSPAEPDLASPKTYTRYFERLYASAANDKSIRTYREKWAFETVAREFQLIDDNFTTPVVVPYGDWQVALSAFTTPEKKPLRARFRALQPFMVNAPCKTFEAWHNNGWLNQLDARYEVFCVRNDARDQGGKPLYDPSLGLRASLIDPTFLNA